jgi:hypothetical protein
MCRSNRDEATQSGSGVVRTSFARLDRLGAYRHLHTTRIGVAVVRVSLHCIQWRAWPVVCRLGRDFFLIARAMAIGVTFSADAGL